MQTGSRVFLKGLKSHGTIQFMEVSGMRILCNVKFDDGRFATRIPLSLLEEAEVFMPCAAEDWKHDTDREMPAVSLEERVDEAETSPYAFAFFTSAQIEEIKEKLREQELDSLLDLEYGDDELTLIRQR
jgi:hypothetical protein